MWLALAEDMEYGGSCSILVSAMGSLCMILIVLLALGCHYEKGLCQVDLEHSPTWSFSEPCIT